MLSILELIILFVIIFGVCIVGNYIGFKLSKKTREKKSHDK
jgi:hypothetical protein